MGKSYRDLRKDSAEIITETCGVKLRLCRQMITHESVQDVATKIGLDTHQYLLRIEQGKKPASYPLLFLLAAHYNIEVGFFINPNLAFSDWWDESRRSDLGIRPYNSIPEPYNPYEIPNRK